MLGDKYRIFYHKDGHTISYGDPVDTWKQAKALRGRAFDGIKTAKAVWIMRYNPSLDLKCEKFGFTLSRST